MVGNGPGSEDRTIILPCLRRIVQISHCYTLRENILSYLTDVSEIYAQMIQFILTISFCAGWQQIIVMDTACLQIVEIYYYGGFVPLFVIMCHSLSSCVLPWINTGVFYQLILYQLS
jgi:hypothetical protein